MTDEQGELNLDQPAATDESGLPDDGQAPGHDHGPGGTHSAAHGARRVGGTRADRNIVVFGLGMLLCAILIAFLPDLAPRPTSVGADRLHGRIATVLPSPRPGSGSAATVTILDGDRRGDIVAATLEGPTGAADLPDYRSGDEVLVAIDTQADGTVAYAVVDRWRLPILGWLLGGFALALIAIAGWAGLRAVTSLAITLAVVVRLLIPLLLAGYDPLALAVGLGIVVTVLSLLLTHGLSRTTAAAVAGTTLGLLVTAGLAVAVSAGAQFSLGQGSEEIVVLGQVLGSSIDLSGLLLAAVIFGGLGVLTDVAVTQAVTVEEFGRLEPALSAQGLFRRSMSVGIAHLTAAINTLVLAYLGAALPVIVILALQVHRLDLALNDEHIAVEVVRTFVGALGVISAVPLTTAIAAIWVTRARHARRRGPRVMATRLGGPATRRAWRDRLNGLRSIMPAVGPVARADVVPAEPAGRRRSTRPTGPERPAKAGAASVIQTELPLVLAAEPKASAAEGPPEATDEVAPAAEAEPAPAAPGPADPTPPSQPNAPTPPTPPTQPVAGRRPRRRGPR